MKGNGDVIWQFGLFDYSGMSPRLISHWTQILAIVQNIVGVGWSYLMLAIAGLWYVCINIYICIYTYIHTYICVYIYIYVCMYVYTYMYLYMYIYIYTYIQQCPFYEPNYMDLIKVEVHDAGAGARGIDIYILICVHACIY